ncbi:MAG: nucleotidyl transferase AbiEii/AbiGii toxin family protein [Chloroflexi bacterium]|nr:nucleotidyl transferase AbiEii/AbiGii toxin family protein [Chloroflexota bacterium]
MFTALLEKIALALDEAGIPYMIIGGQAVLLYGEPRLTKDIDITLGAGLDRLTDVLGLAQGAGLKPLVNPDTFTRKTLVLPCEDPTTGIRVDFVFSFSPYERQALERVRRVRVGEADVRFASLEDVIIHKIVAGRPRDLEDVRAMLLKNSSVDLAYTRTWLRDFSDALSEPLLDKFDQILRETGLGTSPECG